MSDRFLKMKLRFYEVSSMKSFFFISGKHIINVTDTDDQISFIKHD